MSYTTDDFIAGVKRRAAIPTANATFQAIDFLALGDTEIRSSLLPKIMSVRESFYSYNIDQALSTTIQTYSIPTRAIGAKLDGVYLVNSANGQKMPLRLVQEEEVYDLSVSPVGAPCFYFKSNTIVVVPLPMIGNWDTLRMAIFARPNQLAQTSACAQITGINGNTLQCGNVPTTFTTATLIDLLNGSPHYDFRAIDIFPATVNTGTGGSIVLTSVPAGLVAGDWVSLAQTSPVLQIPVELQPMLEQLVANTCLRAQGMQAALAAGEKKLQELQQDNVLLINPRAERAAKKIRNTTGLLRRNSWGW